MEFATTGNDPGFVEGKEEVQVVPTDIQEAVEAPEEKKVETPEKAEENTEKTEKPAETSEKKEEVKEEKSRDVHDFETIEVGGQEYTPQDLETMVNDYNLAVAWKNDKEAWLNDWRTDKKAALMRTLTAVHGGNEWEARQFLNTVAKEHGAQQVEAMIALQREWEEQTGIQMSELPEEKRKRVAQMLINTYQQRMENQTKSSIQAQKEEEERQRQLSLQQIEESRGLIAGMEEVGKSMPHWIADAKTEDDVANNDEIKLNAARIYDGLERVRGTGKVDWKKDVAPRLAKFYQKKQAEEEKRLMSILEKDPSKIPEKVRKKLSQNTIDKIKENKSKGSTTGGTSKGGFTWAQT